MQCPGAMQKLLEITNLHKLFEIHETEEGAISAFYQRTARPEERWFAAPWFCVSTRAAKFWPTCASY